MIFDQRKAGMAGVLPDGGPANLRMDELGGRLLTLTGAPVELTRPS